ncbi:hypothetical protein ABG067_007957 [Albugo candida]
MVFTNLQAVLWSDLEKLVDGFFSGYQNTSATGSQALATVLEHLYNLQLKNKPFAKLRAYILDCLEFSDS